MPVARKENRYSPPGQGFARGFGIQEVYGLHNMPGVAVGEFRLRPGAVMASSDEFTIEIVGRGAHAAQPHNSIDPVLVGSQVVLALQSIAARSAGWDLNQ